VFRARALEGPQAGQAVAVKRLLPELAGDPHTVQVFEREAAITRELRHPAIVSVYDSGVAEGLPYIVMEYVDGRDMRRVMAQCARRGILLPVDFAAYLVHVVAGARPLERPGPVHLGHAAPAHQRLDGAAADDSAAHAATSWPAPATGAGARAGSRPGARPQGGRCDGAGPRRGGTSSGPF